MHEENTMEYYTLTWSTVYGYSIFCVF